MSDAAATELWHLSAVVRGNLHHRGRRRPRRLPRPRGRHRGHAGGAACAWRGDPSHHIRPSPSGRFGCSSNRRRTTCGGHGDDHALGSQAARHIHPELAYEKHQTLKEKDS